MGEEQNTVRAPCLDQTGDIKPEGNVEYRFGIYERFKGTLFVDAGNVWLLMHACR